MTNNDPVILERDGAVARITLNRPDKGNTIDVPLARGLLDAALACRQDDGIRCVLLTGNGRLFCGGGDVGCFAESLDNMPALLRDLTTPLHSAIGHLSRMDKPLITAINGPAAGAGLSLAVLGDVALASSSAHFSLAYPAIGLTADGGATWLLPRLIGLRKVQEMALTNRRFSADEAVAMGLVTRVVEGDKLAEEADALARQAASSATGALGAVRRLLLSSFGASLEEQMEAEASAIAQAGAGAEAREGITAFLEKRKPEF